MGFVEELNSSVVPAIAELYKITAYNDVFYYTSYFKDVEYNEIVYTAKPIKRSKTEKNDQFKKNQFSITVPLVPGVLVYLANSTLIKLSVEIYLYMPEAGFILKVFDGEATKFTFNEKQLCEIALEESFNLKGLEFPPDTFHSFCNHSFCDSDCGLNVETYTKNGIVSNLSSDKQTIYSSIIATESGVYWEYGRVRSGNETRLIQKDNAIPNAVTVLIPFTNLEIGDSFEIIPGCSKTPSECTVKYGNFQNGFGGFPYVPSKNPILYSV